MFLSRLGQLVVLGLLLGVLVVVPSSLATQDRTELRKFLTPDGRLQSPFVFRDGQQGFAGVSGEIWTIGPQGHFTIARFLNEKIDAPYWEHDLTPDQLKGIAKVMAANNFCELPESFGVDSKVNAHLLTLSFGKKESTLALKPGEAVGTETIPSANNPQSLAWRNFVAIVLAIQELAKNLKPA